MARRTTVLAKREDNPGDDEAARWKLQIKQFEKDNEQWENRCEEILKRYRDERSDNANMSPRRFNVLWSNVQTLKPSLYSREPVPIAERRFLDKDVVGRVASQMLERAMRYEMMDCGFHETVSKCVYDYLLPGRGVAWLRFTPAFGPASSIEPRGDDQLEEQNGDPVDEDRYEDRSPEKDEHDESTEATDETSSEKVIGARIDIDYVNWRDFLHSKARTWRETEWIARRLYMSRDDLIDNFGREIGKDVPLDRIADEKSSAAQRGERVNDSLKKATVYEIWCKYDRKVYFVAKGFDRLLEEPRDDPLNLEGFWPCPEPLFATMTNDTLRPVPDYIEYQDQAYELDRLTQRIDALLSALLVRGVYNGANKELARLLDEGSENKMIAIKDWAGFGEKGGLKGAVDFMPIDMIASTLKELFEARDKIKQDLYEITGLADVMRGQADPRETATAIKTKGRFGSMRLQDRQIQVARFCRDLIRMMGEIIAEHYPDQTLIDVSGIMYDEGVGPMMPTEPKKPEEQAPPNPMMGHNGGPPMGNSGMPIAAGMPLARGGAQPQGLPPPALMPPQGAMPPQGPMAPGAPPLPSQGMQPPPAAGSPPQQPGMAPPGILPEQQYAMDMADYQIKRQKAEAEKQQLVEKAIGLLRQDKLRGFRIDIETDSTIINDAQEDKQSRVEFIGALSGFIKESVQAAQLYPQMVPLLGKIMLFGVRGFRVGRDLESAIEEFTDQAEKEIKASQGKPKPPDPKIQAEQIKMQAEIQKAQIDAQSSADDNKRAMAQKEADGQLSQQKMQMQQQQMQQEMAMKEREFQMKMAEMEMKMSLAEREMQGKLQLAEREGSMKMHLAERDHARQLEAGETAHRQQMESGQMNMHIAKVGHDQKLEAGEAAHEQKLEAAKARPNGPA